MIFPCYMGVVMLFRVLAIATVAIGAAPVLVQARSMDQTQGPAELPPLSFKGNQFVDSSGCIFLRAGFGGQVSWVPRVTRDRQLMCGYKPTFAANETRPRASSGFSMRMPLAQPAAPPGSAEVAAAPEPTRELAPVPAAMPRAKQPVMAAEPVRPARSAAVPAGPAIGGNAVQLVSQSRCAGYSPEVSKVYTLSDGRSAISCGAGTNTYMVVRVVSALPAPAPQTGSRNVPIAPPAPLLPYRSEPAGSAPYTSYTYTRPATPAPQPPAEAPAAGAPFEQTALAQPTIPPGYKRAWKDDRLNPLRGPRTAEGDAQMDLVWTHQVPRQLISTTTRRNVGAQYPGLTYPNTLPQQPARAVRPMRTSQRMAGQHATLSTSNLARAASPMSGGRYVQVGSFGVPANAADTASRLRALGYPVAVSDAQTRGHRLQNVMAGPFATAARLSAALGRVRAAGFVDAYIR